MKNLIAMALATIMVAGVGASVIEGNTSVNNEEIISEATAIVEMYDIDANGELSEEEVQALLDDMVEKYDIEFDQAELETAVNEAVDMLDDYDIDGDGELSYDEQLGLIQDVYKAYDNGEIQNEEFKKILEGYERKVNDLNSYHDILDEVGVPGKGVHINIRGNNN